MVCRPLRGLGFILGRDPRVTLAALAHPGLHSVTASRFLDANIQADAVLRTCLHQGAIELVGPERQEHESKDEG
jgi:hypothetical protein